MNCGRPLLLVAGFAATLFGCAGIETPAAPESAPSQVIESADGRWRVRVFAPDPPPLDVPFAMDIEIDRDILPSSAWPVARTSQAQDAARNAALPALL